MASLCPLTAAIAPDTEMSTALNAADPTLNATVMASAGTGKTWLLVTRLVRLLLAGARPDSILAVTFTRKAAAEMLGRLEQRLAEYVALPDPELDEALRALGLEPDAERRDRARGLYEQLLFGESSVRTTTFHAFCQEVLRRFPLEAGVPPGFELLEATGLLERQAWDALYAEATRAPGEAPARALETLYDRCGGLPNTHGALNAFLHYRSDWWAFCEGHEDPVRWAAQTLKKTLGIEPATDFAQAFFSTETMADLERFASLLAAHTTKTNARHAAVIGAILAGDRPDAERFEQLRTVFFTDKGTPRARKESASQQKSMGADGQQTFLELHGRLCERITATLEQLARRNTLEISQAWYTAGQRLLEHYQRIKREQRWLDFADLEWNTYRLLNHADNAHWVQYKLDQRIDHFLIDEFQDTNPTQWRLLLPLLEELAAGNSERKRSVFLVGDAKQSIYGFRRADPRLLDNAAQWLGDHLAGGRYTLDHSWRSCPAVIDCVNAVFAAGPLHNQLPTFTTHATHRQALWGQVELLPLATSEDTAQAQAGDTLRDPLQTPRPVEEDRRHQQEARMIAKRIRALVDQRTPIADGNGSRAARYSDVFILLRKRTHASVIERALRDANIPYVGAERGTLLSTLEIQDLEALLTILIMPYDNLALAQVLRSPLFAADDSDLLRLAQAGGGHWLERLAAFADEPHPDAPLARAHRLLNRWRGWVGRVPVHDLLDRIYSEADVLGRYEANFPGPLKTRVRANLARFLELALEVDAGRYPSLPHFLDRLRELRRHELEAPDAPPAGGAEDRVRILTIHAAKGLEAPVVVLADAAGARRERGGYQAVVDWPTNQARPSAFLLTAKRDQQDEVSRALLDARDHAARREDANLLYVALTRARQYLVISASEPGRGGELGWFGVLRERLGEIAEERAGTLVLESGQAPPLATPPTMDTERAPPLDPRLTQPLAVQPPPLEIAPSRSTETIDPTAAPQEDGRLRGLAVHRLLEWFSSGTDSEAPVLPQLASELGIGTADPRLRAWRDEALQVIGDPNLAELFDARRYACAYNEVPIHYRHGERRVHGVIDRVVVTSDEVLVLDYKTHREAVAGQLAELAARYREQMQWYVEGVRLLWPEKHVRGALLFTACRELYPLALE